METEKHNDGSNQPESPKAVESNGNRAEVQSDSETENRSNDQGEDKRLDSQMDAQPIITGANGTHPDEPAKGIDPEIPPSGQESAAEADSHNIDPKEQLEPYGWYELEERFLAKMDECQRREEEIEREFREWCQVSYFHLSFFSSFFLSIFSSLKEKKRKQNSKGILLFLRRTGKSHHHYFYSLFRQKIHLSSGSQLSI